MPLDSGVAGVLAITILMWVSYIVVACAYVLQVGREVGILSALVQLPASFLVLNAAMLASAIGVVTVAVTWVSRRRRVADRTRAVRVVQGLVAALLLFPFAVLGAGVLEFPRTMLICLPSTAFGLWAVHRMQRFRRIPVRLLLMVFGWGALVAAGFAGSVIYLFRATLRTVLMQGSWRSLTPARIAEINHDVSISAMIFAGVWEELAKAAGVAVALLLARRHVDGIVTGLVLGAACGLGFNFVESIGYIAVAGDGAAHQYFMRQSVGLFAAHTTFSAVAGAGIGAARQLTDHPARAITGGLLAAMGGHMASNVIFSWYGQNGQRWFDPSPLVDLLVLQPALLLVVQGPLLVTFMVLLQKGLRAQAGGLGRQLTAEARAGTGTIAPVEVPMLLRPGRRLWLKVVLLRRHGLAAWRNTSRLHAAQLDLATARWHLARLEADPLADGLEELRERVRSLKRRQADIVATVRRRPVEVEA